MHRTKLAILASTALCIGFETKAADLPVKARPSLPVVSDNWVGFYAGGNIGYSWGRADTQTTVGSFVQNALFQFDFPGGSSAARLHPNGIVGGLQIGYNWRVAPKWLAGLETDFQWTGQKKSAFGGFTGATTDCTTGDCSFINTTDITAKLSWFGTVRGRIGPEWNGLWIYGTGGLAYGKVSVSGVNTVVLIDNPNTVVGTYTTPFTFSKTKAGWTAGFGAAGAIAASRWTWKIEYIHIDLGSIGSASFGGVPDVTINVSKFTDDILRFGLNYQFTAWP